MVIRRTPRAAYWCAIIGCLFAYWGYSGMLTYSTAENIFWNMTHQQIEASFLPSPENITCLSARFQNVFNDLLQAERLPDACARTFVSGKYIFGLMAFFFLLGLYLAIRKEELPDIAPLDIGPLTEQQKLENEERKRRISENLDVDRGRGVNPREIGS